MTRILETNDLAAMFGIELDTGATDTASVSGVMCSKCKGKGRFVGYSGRVVGNCFACDGTGLDRAAGVVVAEGDCAKCLGTGEWRTGRPCFACGATGKADGNSATISVDAIATAFAAARGNGIKAPRLRLASFVFSRAPDHGRNAGSIYVKHSGSGDYLGRVTDGRFHPVAACDAVTKGEVIAVASDPHSAAKAYGMRTGSCSCCGRVLTNGLSVELGIGPICRDKFGW